MYLNGGCTVVSLSTGDSFGGGPPINNCNMCNNLQMKMKLGEYMPW
jgi:hypothetical protein